MAGHRPGRAPPRAHVRVRASARRSRLQSRRTHGQHAHDARLQARRSPAERQDICGDQRSDHAVFLTMWSGRRLVALQHGQASIAMPASGWFCGPKGRLHSGIFAFLLDMTHLYSVVSTLPAGGGCTTAELSVTVLGEPPPSGAQITGRSQVVYSDERNALAEGLVTGPGGRPLAHSTSRYFLFA